MKNDKIPLILPLYLYNIKYNIIVSYACLLRNLVPNEIEHIYRICAFNMRIYEKMLLFSLIAAIDCKYCNVNILRWEDKFYMEELTTVILSGIAWDAIKSGIKISANYLKNKLSNWLLEDSQLEEISNYMQNIPNIYCISEGMIKEYLNTNQKLLGILKEAKQKDLRISQKSKGDHNLIIGYNQGPVTINL